MTERKSLLRRVYDTVIDGRTRQAQRAIRQYLQEHPSLDRAESKR